MAGTLDGQFSVSALYWIITMYEDQYSGQSSHDISARVGCEKSPSPVLCMHCSVEYRLSYNLHLVPEYGVHTKTLHFRISHFQSEAFLLVESISESLLSRIPTRILSTVLETF